MKDFFKQFQDTQQGFMQNPMSLAGLMVAGGRNYNDAITEASRISREQQLAQAQAQQVEFQKQKAMYQQQIQEKLQSRIGNLFAGGNKIGQKEAAIELLNAGMDPRNVANIAKLFGNQGSGAPKTFKGAGGILYEQVRNPQTGQLEAREIPGQKAVTAITPAQQRVNSVKLKEISNDARSAQTELRILDDLEKAFDKLDKNTGEYSKSGTLAAKAASIFDTAPNILYKDQAQSALQQIEKGNSLLFQNRVKAAGGRATDAFKAEVKKGLPSAKLTAEARRELFIAKRRENLEGIARSKFYNEWAKQNHKDIDGAEDAFIAFIDHVPLVDDEGRANKQIINEIPNIVSQYLTPEGRFQEELGEEIQTLPTEEVLEEEEDFGDLEQLPLETLIELRSRKLRGR